jgi:hypothetical protein
MTKIRLARGFTAGVYVLLLLVPLFLQGCVSSVALSSDDKSRIRTVSVNQADIEVPQELYYHGPAQAALGALGLVGGLAGAGMAEEPRAKLKEMTGIENIQLAAILQAAFKRGLGESTTLRVVENNADAKIKIKVTSYGLRISEPFATTVKPWITARVTLVDSADKVVFENLYIPEITSSGDFAQVYPSDEYLAKPALFRSGLERAAEVMAEKMTAGLK